MEETRVTLTMVKGRKTIKYNDLVYCNLRWNYPYMAVCKGEDMIWQDKLYSGYGKNAEAFYAVDELVPGDLIKVAGGSGKNKYPYTGKVIEITETKLVLEDMTDLDFDNAVIEAGKEINPSDFSHEEQILLKKLKKLPQERIKALLQALEN